MNPTEPSAPPPIAQIKASMRTAWMAGDFGVVAKQNIRAAEQFARRLSIPAGARVLDVACGTGNVAIPLARQGCIVTGVDIAPNLLVQGRQRAADEDLEITFKEGDAEQLPYPDASFDAVVSMWGAMFAPRPELVAAECARVLVPGGLLAMANWNPASFSGRMFQVNARHLPPPPGVPPPVLWGDEPIVHERLASAFTSIQTQIIQIEIDLPMTPPEVVAFFRTWFGPTQMAFARLDPAGRQALTADLENLYASANVSPDPTRTLIANEYLQVLATRI
jgi:2-polyprenyl-3-methyl-5-hydroxy-6-metoxy-1,4-benzoquinol methylase